MVSVGRSGWGSDEGAWLQQEEKGGAGVKGHGFRVNRGWGQ